MMGYLVIIDTTRITKYAAHGFHIIIELLQQYFDILPILVRVFGHDELYMSI